MVILCNFVRALNHVSYEGILLTCRRVHNKNGRFYTKKHEWVKVEAGICTVGISNYAQESLGEIVFAQLPDKDKNLCRGDECAALESVKAAGEVYSPVSGTVIEKNSAVESTPSLINKSCYEEGWLFRLKQSKPDEMEHLMNQNAYDTYLKDLH